MKLIITLVIAMEVKGSDNPMCNVSRKRNWPDLPQLNVSVVAHNLTAVGVDMSEHLSHSKHQLAHSSHIL